MNIGIVLYPTYGGSGVVGTELGKALANQGHNVHFITYRQPVKLEEFTANISYHEVRVSDYPLFDYPPYELVLASKLVDVVKYEKLDLLHVHYAIPHASAAYMAQQILKTEGIEIPFITTLHGTDITLVGKDASFEPVITFAINQSNGVTAVSESLKRDTYEHFKIKNGIDVIPNFICMKQYEDVIIDEHLKSSLAPNGERLVIHISNFRKVKRVSDVVKVFAQIRAEMPAKLVMVGDGPERNKIEQMCRTLGLCSDLQMMGKVNDTIRVLSIADLFILPSQSESFGLAALEAMAAKTPVISTNTGGIPEVNINGETGFMSNIGDVDDMAKNALTILKDNSTLNRFKTNAFEQAKRFDLGKILPQYIALYERILKSHLS
jgi:N-acetyl-alpha-D-glucosaminyl L-malate synthase BshA